MTSTVAPPTEASSHSSILQSTSRPFCMAKQAKEETRRSVEHCTPHADGAWLNKLGWSQQ